MTPLLRALPRSRLRHLGHFGVRAAASVFNVITVWAVFHFFGDRWGGDFYLHLSSVLIVSTLARLGVDQSLLLSARQIAIPLRFLGGSWVVSWGLFLAAEFFGLAPTLHWAALGLALGLAHAIAYAEAIVRTLPESSHSHAAVIGIQSACILCVGAWQGPVGWTLVLVLALQLGFYLALIRTKGGTIDTSHTSELGISACGLVHGAHGLINQNFLNYFVTRFGAAQELPYIVTLVRILYLSSWPLSQFTFSGIYEKSKKAGAFRESGLFWGACVLAVVCFASMLAYAYAAPVPQLLPSGVLLSIGIISFSLGADKMYRPVGHAIYNFLLPFQFIVVIAGLGLGQLDVLNNLIIVSIFSIYLTTCSLLSRFFP